MMSYKGQMFNHIFKDTIDRADRDKQCNHYLLMKIGELFFPGIAGASFIAGAV